MLLFIFLALTFVLFLAGQLILCLKSKHALVKASPVYICILALIYAGARYGGIIIFPDDTTSLVESGAIDGIIIGAYAVVALIASLLAWAVYLFLRWREDLKNPKMPY